LKLADMLGRRKREARWRDGGEGGSCIPLHGDHHEKRHY